MGHHLSGPRSVSQSVIPSLIVHPVYLATKHLLVIDLEIDSSSVKVENAVVNFFAWSPLSVKAILLEHCVFLKPQLTLKAVIIPKLLCFLI